ncbi:hydrolase, partial [Pseudomonas syringae pv. tagetis]
SLENMRTIWDFDGRVTAPLHGFTDATEYYRRASSRYYLGQIRTQTLIIQSRDDPFVLPHTLPDPSEQTTCTEIELH